ncbi:MAG: ergothioneine biosynthesis protein EgtC, partial [Sandaracinaceae bacterium]
MCRLAAYVGPERDLRSLWLAPPHSLVVQSYAPKELAGAILNADGFGAAWYTDAGPEPALYRTVMPLWGDENFPRMAAHLRTRHALANVRSATPGFGIQSTNVSPFVVGRHAFSHNGFVERFRDVMLRRLRDGLDDARYREIEGNTDSEHLFAHVRMGVAALGDDADPRPAVRDRLRDVARWAEEAGVRALLNVLWSDGRWLCATRFAVGAAAPTHYNRPRADGGDEVGRAPHDDRPRWRAVATEP